GDHGCPGSSGRFEVGGTEGGGGNRVGADQGPLAGQRPVDNRAGVGVEDDDALAPVGVIGEGEGVGRPRVPDTVGHFGVDVEVAEEHEVGAQGGGVDLDLVDVAA